METQKIEGLWSVCLCAFRESLCADPDVPIQVATAVLSLIRRARRRHSSANDTDSNSNSNNNNNNNFNDNDNDALVIGAVRMMTELGLFQSHVEKPLLEETRRFYYEEGERLFASSMTSPIASPQTLSAAPQQQFTATSSAAGGSGIVGVLEAISARIAGEERRTAAYLSGDVKTRREVLRVVDEELIKERLPALLGGEGLGYLISERRIAELRVLYTLVKKIGCVSDLRRRFAEVVEAHGANILLDFAGEGSRTAIVQRLLAYRDLLESVVRGPFEANEAMTSALHDSLEHCMDKEQGRISDAIALFLDAEVLRAYKERRQSQQAQGEREFQGTVDKVVDLFRMVGGKEVFAESYRAAFARRVLGPDRQEYWARARGLEDYVLDRVRDECGTIFTKELDEMARDVTASRDLTCEYAGRKYPNPRGIAVGMLVLGQNAWAKTPEIGSALTQLSTAPQLPGEVQNLFDTFRTFYASKKEKAKLTVLPTLSTFSLRARFRAGDKEIIALNLSYVLTFLAFNNAEKLTVRNLQEKTKVPLRELIEILRCLTSKSVHILSLEPPPPPPPPPSSAGSSAPVSPAERWRNLDNVISVNNNFAYKKQKLSFKCGDGSSGSSKGSKAAGAAAAAAAAAAAKEKEGSISATDKIVAAIARVLKKASTIPFSLLVGETQRLLGFNITPADLKVPISKLIEKQIIKYNRDANTYEYIPL